MGCDIHLHVEERTASGWLEVGAESDWYDGRDYRFFAVLANVRNNGSVTPISPPRGLPEDIGPQLRECCGVEYEDIGTHSHSWLTARELAAYDGWRDPFWIESVKRMCELAGDDLDSVRIVFWFDN